MERKLSEYVLPHGITSPADIGRLRREAEAADEAIRQAGLRKAGEPVSLPKLSRLLSELLEANHMNMLHEDDRSRLLAMLAHVETDAPTIHMSFSTDPSPAFMQKIISWLRQEIHPLILVRTGLQPGIGAGCIVRTPNKYFDFSLREHFKSQRQLLIDKLHEMGRVPDERTG